MLLVRRLRHSIAYQAQLINKNPLNLMFITVLGCVIFSLFATNFLAIGDKISADAGQHCRPKL